MTIMVITNFPGLPFAKYSGEKHFSNHNFTGTNTNLKERLNAGDTPKSESIPINRVDLASYRYDLACSDIQNIASRHMADKKMIQYLNEIENPSFRERFVWMLVKKALQTKLFLGEEVS